MLTDYPKAFMARAVAQDRIYSGREVGTVHWNPADISNIHMCQNDLDSITWDTDAHCFKNVTERMLKLHVEFRLTLWGCPANVMGLDAWWQMANKLEDMDVYSLQDRYGFVAMLNPAVPHASVTSRTILLVPAHAYFVPRFFCDQSGTYTGTGHELGGFVMDKSWATFVQVTEEGV